jgi:hypothetical protein
LGHDVLSHDVTKPKTTEKVQLAWSILGHQKWAQKKQVSAKVDRTVTMSFDALNCRRISGNKVAWVQIVQFKNLSLNFANLVVVSAPLLRDTTQPDVLSSCNPSLPYIPCSTVPQ